MLYYYFIFRSQVFTYVCHLSKMQYLRFKRRIFLLILKYFLNHLNFAYS